MASQHNALQDDIRTLLMTINPNELLELEHDCSLLDIDFDVPGVGPAENHLTWAASMNTVINAA